MNLKDFKDIYNGAPIDLQEMAENICRKLDIDGVGNPQSELINLSYHFLRSKIEFEGALREAGIELG